MQHPRRRTQALGAELERRRRAAQVSQTALAALLGLSRQTIHRKLSGRTPLTVDEAGWIAVAVGSNLRDVLAAIECIDNPLS